MDIALKRGRLLGDRDVEGARQVAVVNEAFVRTFFGSRNPMGQRVTFGTADDDPSWLEMVGVVGDVRQSESDLARRARDLRPAQQVSADFWTIFMPLPLSFVVRSELSSDVLDSGHQGRRARGGRRAAGVDGSRPVGDLVSATWRATGSACCC